MDAFCGDGWNGKWTTSADLQPCIEALLFITPAHIILFIIAAIHLRGIRGRRALQPVSRIEPRLPALCLCLLSVCPLLPLIHHGVDGDHEQYELVTESLGMVGWVTATAAYVLERRSLLPLPLSIRIAWCIECVMGVKGVESVLVRLWSNDDVEVRHSVDGRALLKLFRLPLYCILFLYAILWRRLGYDDAVGNTEHLVNSEYDTEVLNRRRGLYGGGDPYDRVLAIDDDEDDIDGYAASHRVVASDGMGTLNGADGSGKKENASLWQRFMHFTKNSDDTPSNTNARRRSILGIHSARQPPMTLEGVVHVDSASFVRQNAPLPRDGPRPHTASDADGHSPRSPSSHPLSGCVLSVPSCELVAGLGGLTSNATRSRVKVQYCVRVHIRSADYASGDEGIDTLSVWKKRSEFEGLQQMLQQVQTKYRLPALPPLPTPLSSLIQPDEADLELSRREIESYLVRVMAETAYWQEISAFIRLSDKLSLIKKHIEYVKSMRHTDDANLSNANTQATNGQDGAVVDGSSNLNVARTRDRAKTTPSQHPPQPHSQQQSFVRPAWSLIGVSVVSWNKWASASEQTTGNAHATANTSRTRQSSITSKERDDNATSRSAEATYVTFVIRVRTSQGDWNLHKRMDEVQALRDGLVKRFPSLPMPHLPVEKDWEKDESSLDRIRRVIEIFLQSVCNTSAFQGAELYAFLLAQDVSSLMSNASSSSSSSTHTGLRRGSLPKDRLISSSDAAAMMARNTPASGNPNTSIKTEAMTIGPNVTTRQKAKSMAITSSATPAASSIIEPLAASPLLSRSINTAEESYFGSNARTSLASDTSTSPANSPSPPPPDTVAGSMIVPVIESPGLEADDDSAMDVPPIPSPSPRHMKERSTFANAAPSPRAASASVNVAASSSAAASARVGSVPSVNPSLLARSYLTQTGSYMQAWEEPPADEDEYEDISSNNGHSRGSSVDGNNVSSAVLPVTRPADSSHRFSVRIASWSFASARDSSIPVSSKKGGNNGGGKHVLFTIIIREFFGVHQYLEWSIERRFMQFDRLHKALKTQFGSSQLPELPPKQLFPKKPSASFLNQRLQLLEVYLQQLINTTTFQVDDFFTFFDMKNPARKIKMGSINEQQSDTQEHHTYNPDEQAEMSADDEHERA